MTFSPGINSLPNADDINAFLVGESREVVNFSVNVVVDAVVVGCDTPDVEEVIADGVELDFKGEDVAEGVGDGLGVVLFDPGS